MEIRDITKRQSKTKLDLFRTCPKKYWFSEYYPQEQKDSYHMIKGSELHNLFYEFYIRNQERLIDNEEIIKRFDSIKNGTEYFDQVILFVKEFLEKYNYPWPVSMEDKIYSKKFDFVIKWDRIDYDGKIRIIWDYKTGAKYTGQRFIDKFKFELLAYAFIYMYETKQRVHKVGVYFIDHGHDEIINVTDEDIKWFIKEYKQSMRDMNDYQNQNVWPAKRGWYCKLCGWNEMCEVYNNKK